VLHRREAVRNDEHGTVRHEALDRLLYEPFRFGVERAGRFVENEDRRIAEQRARDGDALALATAEPRAAFAKHRVVGLGQPHDEFVGIRRAGRGTHLIERHILQAVGDVREHRVVEQHRFLRHDAHQSPQGCPGVVGQGHTVGRISPRVGS